MAGFAKPQHMNYRAVVRHLRKDRDKDAVVEAARAVVEAHGREHRPAIGSDVTFWSFFDDLREALAALDAREGV